MTEEAELCQEGNETMRGRQKEGETGRKGDKEKRQETVKNLSESEG